MGDVVPQVLIVTSWIANFFSKRKEKKMSQEYQDAGNLLFFRPVEDLDLPRIIQLEVQCVLWNFDLSGTNLATHARIPDSRANQKQAILELL
jgi:hypothetical protein